MSERLVIGRDDSCLDCVRDDIQPGSTDLMQEPCDEAPTEWYGIAGNVKRTDMRVSGDSYQIQSGQGPSPGSSTFTDPSWQTMSPPSPIGSEDCTTLALPKTPVISTLGITLS